MPPIGPKGGLTAIKSNSTPGRTVEGRMTSFELIMIETQVRVK